LRIAAGDCADRIGRPIPLLALAEVLPEMAEMIERVWVESLLHGVGPLLVCNGYIPDRTPQHSAKSIDNVAHRWGFAHQRVDPFGRQAGAGRKGSATRATSSAPARERTALPSPHARNAALPAPLGRKQELFVNPLASYGPRQRRALLPWLYFTLSESRSLKWALRLSATTASRGAYLFRLCS
jgi:hypothetical protein